MDIDFRNNDYHFLVRCSAIITNNEKNKVILFRVIGRDFWMLPGGRINYLEDSECAIKREMKEELGIEEDYHLVCIEENILADKKIQNIEFIYHTEVDNIEQLKSLENKGQEFKVVALENLSDYVLKPEFLNQLLMEYDSNKIWHKINIESEENKD